MIPPFLSSSQESKGWGIWYGKVRQQIISTIKKSLSLFKKIGRRERTSCLFL